MIGQGDYFQTQVNYTQGALKYIFQNPNGNPYVQDRRIALPTASYRMRSMAAHWVLGLQPTWS